jgi:HlyD family secretion protein
MARSNGKGWVKWIIILLLLGGAGYGGWRWYAKREKEEPIEYKTAAVARGELIQQVTANGQINAVKNVAEGSQVSGLVTDINVDFNSHVTNGQIIAQIDPSTYQQSITQADAELANAAAGLELTVLNWKRAQALRASNLIPEADYDQALVSMHQAEAVVKTREASLKKAKVDLERTTIYAPIDGMVISRVVDVGQTVAASFNAPTLFNIANDLAKMQIDAMVSEADVGGVEEGQSVTFTVDAFPQRKFRGSVKQVRFAPTTNQNVVNYVTVVEVNNADLKLRPGMTANANILVAEHKDVLRIPNGALRFRPPPGAVIEGATNAPVEKAKAEIATSGPFAGLPIPPWQAKGERRRPTDEERAAYESSLTPEQKQKYQEIIAAMRAARAAAQGDGGGPGGSGGGERPRRAEPTGPRSQTIYLLTKEASATGAEKTVLKPVTVKVGISDGANTEVLEGLKEGDVVVVGTVSSAAGAAAPASPFGNPFGGPGRR